MKKHLKQAVIIALMLTTSSVNAQWTQIGSDIDGEVADDHSGISVCISADGFVVAIGAVDNDGNGSDAGHVRIFENISGTWSQIGSDIDGEVAGDLSGHSVSLSADGSIVAIGANRNEDNGYRSGHVRIYENISGTWTQLGSDIAGEAVGDNSGYSVSLSADGSIVAIGAIGNDGNGTDAGHVRVFKNIAGTWTQIGADIDGEAVNDYSGWSVSLSSDGSVVAIGANRNSENGMWAGHVRIYRDSSGIWTQIGSDIDGDSGADFFGESVSLSADGSVVAGGSPRNDGNGSEAGHVRVYENISGTWVQIGNDLEGEAAGDYAFQCALSSDGNTIAIGAYRNDVNSTAPSAGHVRIYKNIANTWTQIGSDIDGESPDYSGKFVSLSGDGSVVAIGAPFNSGNGTYSGHVRIYTNPTIGLNEHNNTIAISLYPNPTSGKIIIQCKGMQQLEILDITGKTVYQQSLSSDILEMDISTYSKGVYLVKVTTTDAVIVEQIVLE